MQVTEQNERIANSIMEILAKENCTVEQATSILHFLQGKVARNSTVQNSKD
jgi:hypothetical protein